MVPESQDLESLASQQFIPTGIVSDLSIFGMPPAVEFDHQAAIETDEVEDVASERRLSPEVETFGSQLPQANPEADFGICHRFSKGASARNGRACAAPIHHRVRRRSPFPTRGKEDGFTPPHSNRLIWSPAFSGTLNRLRSAGRRVWFNPYFFTASPNRAAIIAATGPVPTMRDPQRAS
jgi:hypothetical protein